RGIPEHDRDAVIPASVFRGVISRLIHPDLRNSSHLLFFFHDRIMVFLEQHEEFVRIAPLGLVVILNGKRLVSGRRALREGSRGQGNRATNPASCAILVIEASSKYLGTAALGCPTETYDAAPIRFCQCDQTNQMIPPNSTIPMTVSN